MSELVQADYCCGDVVKTCDEDEAIEMFFLRETEGEGVYKADISIFIEFLQVAEV